MPEVATESFCERCGTRYAVESGGVGGLRRARAMFSGLTHYVMSQDKLSDAISDANRSEEDRLQALELDAFHSTFHFCLNCRQYACGSCWNTNAARCRTCDPMVGPDAPPDPLLTMNSAQAAAVSETTPGPPLPMTDAWPSEDLARPAVAWPEEEPIASVADLEPELFVAAEVEPEPEVIAEPEHFVAAEVEPEPEVVMAEVEPEPEVFLEPEFEPEFVYDVPEPIADIEDVTPTYAPWLYADVPAAETEAQTVFVAEVEPEPLRAPEPEPEPDTPESAARRAKLDLLGLADPGQGTVSVGSQDTIPYHSSGAAPIARRPRALSARMAAAGIWDASAREVAESGGSITECGSCGLSLSASARFCRRCGTPQTKSA